MKPSTHLLTLWNPSYALDAMDAHLDVLLAWAARRAEGKAGDDDAYVWWAKLRSANRQQPLPHKDDVLALDAQIQAGTETHLYLTDFRSLYVGHLGEITADDVRLDDERDHLPEYYLGPDIHADFWFRLFDIRRLVADDTVATIEELKCLRNLRYHDRPVSLYGGLVELPLLVRREGGEAGWFTGRESLIEERLWAERDGRLRGETERLGADLRDNLIGRELWARLGLATRSFLASAEAVYRRHRDDPHFDFAAAAIEYAKAIEVEVNALLRPYLREVDGGRHQSLGWLASQLADPPAPLRKWLGAAFPNQVGWFTGELQLRLGAIAALRNPGAHRTAVPLALVSSLREETLGIGQEGLIVRLARLRESRRAE